MVVIHLMFVSNQGRVKKQLHNECKFGTGDSFGVNNTVNNTYGAQVTPNTRGINDFIVCYENAAYTCDVSFFDGTPLESMGP